MGNLHAHLNAETAELHDQVEALPFFRALHAGRLPETAIVSFLRGLAANHAVLERELRQVSNPLVSDLAGWAPPEIPPLTADLEALDTQGVPSITPAIRIALDRGARVLADADGGCRGTTVGSAAQSIASSRVDERSGITGAPAAACDWFADAGRFSADRIANVRALVIACERANDRPC